MPTEPKTVLAGAMLETSFVRLRSSMAMLSEERAPPLPFGGLGSHIIADAKGGWKKMVYIV